MHELSIAMSILDIASEESDRRGGAQICAVHVAIGPLSGVVNEALLAAFDLAREGTELAAAELVIRETPLLVNCPTCREQRAVESVQSLCCVVCGTPSPDVVSGRELEIVAMELLEEASPPGGALPQRAGVSDATLRSTTTEILP